MPANGDGSKYRKVVGTAIAAFVWILFLIRILTGAGPMHDHQGNQSPAAHYLIGALIVTAMVAAWILVVGRFDRPR